MSLMDPFADLTRLRQHIDHLFEEAAPAGRSANHGRVWRPAVDVYEDDEAVTLLLDLPGAAREKLDVQLSGDELTIHGERSTAHLPNGSCAHAERPAGPFHRSFRIGVPVQADAVEAVYREGILRVRLPKVEAVKPRRVTVRTDGED